MNSVTTTLYKPDLTPSGKQTELKNIVNNTINGMESDFIRCNKLLDTMHKNICYLNEHRLILPIPPSRFETER